MHPEALWHRATLLAQQGRWDLAIDELRRLIGLQPEDAHAHALLAMAFVHTDDLKQAQHEAEQAIANDPELDFAFRALATVHMHQERHDAAAEAIQQAIELDPDDADHRGFLAQIRFAQRRWDEALAAADDGLQIDAQHTDCLNLRSLALTKLGRSSEATASVEASLAHDPDNPYTHQARGYSLLHQGDAKQALHHFQEALRRDPGLEGSRAGLVEALKARNPLYRMVLGWFLWLDRFSPARRFQIVIGLWFFASFGSEAIERAGYPTIALVVSLSWLGFVLLTACSVPFFNLLLLLHPIGRHALERRARTDALLLGGTLAVGLGVFATGVFSTAQWAVRGWVFWLVFLLPIAGLGLFHPGWGRRVLQAFCVLIVGGWIWWAMRTASMQSDAMQLLQRGEANLRTGQAEAFVTGFQAHLALHRRLITAAALSTWFVLLAPKGRARRGRTPR